VNVAILIDTLVGGGAEGVVQRLALGLARRGQRVFVYCLKVAGTPAERLRAAGIVVREGSSRGLDPLLYWRLGRWLHGDGIDVLHAHSCAGLVCAFPAAKLLGVPVMHVRHGWPLGRRSRYARVADWVSHAIECVAVNCETGRARLPAGRVAQRALCLPNGVDPTPMTQERSRELLAELCGRSPQRPIVLSVANIRPEKDTCVLVRAFNLLRRAWPTAELVCVGAVLDRRYAAEVWRDVRALGLEGCVHFPGHCADAARLMRAADVFCLSSRTEGRPNVVLEAMAQEVPIVATAVGDVGRLEPHRASKHLLLRHNQTGLLVPPGNPGALCDALRCALRDRAASEARARRAAERHARDCTTERMVELYERAYACCVRRQREVPGHTKTTATRRRRPGVVMLGPAPPQIGGMVTSIGLLMKSPLRARYELHRVGSPVDPAYCAQAGPGRGMRGVPGVVRAVVRHVGALARLASLLVRKRVAILHIHTCSYFTFYRNLVDLAVARLLGCAVILHVRGNLFERFCAESGRVGRWVIRRGLEAADAVIVLSRGWHDALRPYAGQARLVVVPNAFDPDVLPTREDLAAARAAREDDGPRRPCRFLFLALVREIKGVGDLIEAARLLRARGMPFELRIAGPATDGDGERWRQQVHDAGLGDVVTFVGPVSGPAKARQLAWADCFVHPSHSEGLPNSVLEGGAAGLPVIATAVGAVPEVYDPPDLMAAGESLPLAPLVAPRDPTALAREMERMACDAELRWRIGERLRTRFEAEYSIERLAERISPIYERILESPRTCLSEQSPTAAVAVGVVPTTPGASEGLEAPREAARPRVPTPV
jgi:glycosyltransferase involved in cell wall biosynthesis